MRGTLLHSLLELADSTSQNLGFAHRDDVHVSYGEETITETNLLELRRRHPNLMDLTTFDRKKESTNGADWEWHVIGRRRRLIMRVQAKRVQRNGVLKISHVVKSSGDEQIDLLIEDSKRHGCKPVYCLYASEAQRSHWRAPGAVAGLEAFEYGCLLASARRIKARMPKALSDIEKDCVPWHYLVDRRRYSRSRPADFPLDGGIDAFLLVSQTDQVQEDLGKDEMDPGDPEARGEFPTIDELNQARRPARVLEGVVEMASTEPRLPANAGLYRERGIRMLLETDVSSIEPASPPPPPRRTGEGSRRD